MPIAVRDDGGDPVVEGAEFAGAIGAGVSGVDGGTGALAAGSGGD